MVVLHLTQPFCTAPKSLIRELEGVRLARGSKLLMAVELLSNKGIIFLLHLFFSLFSDRRESQPLLALWSMFGSLG